MSQLSGAKLSLPFTIFNWTTFDALPRHVKELCWEFGCHWNGPPPNEARVPELLTQLETKRRAALLAKLPAHYNQFGWTETPKIDYLWPEGA